MHTTRVYFSCYFAFPLAYGRGGWINLFSRLTSSSSKAYKQSCILTSGIDVWSKPILSSLMESRILVSAELHTESCFCGELKILRSLLIGSYRTVIGNENYHWIRRVLFRNFVCIVMKWLNKNQLQNTISAGFVRNCME